ncbi:hypothetical protein HN695_02370 [Candidatus Woesearchaeota archaeon]|jgi:hypothetical protein|nr:hypothetical protein [Candidatus Woesearchaeota archaeon]MBT5272930.1 hypothetical protein [Candidatus Woesearchaeota archaeon]MBT6041396.1 hypothetical protein [Candidatus Woesearchaeota archaeon]MBT6337279.1 hypothetical protein [Candidatus Woesearchaeota archaeon]MBT7927156.1 hypothetical protein [Candidatus Woesearchaeota archaeon]
MKTAIIFFLFLLIPSALAIDCSLSGDESYCESVKSSDLSEVEKDLLYSSLLYEDSTSPLHNFIKDYNEQIEVIEPPDNVEIHNSNQIKNAWLSFLVLFPSVVENDTLLVADNVEMISAYDYDVYVPNDFSYSYPHTSGGDCKRKHYLTKNEAVLNYYFNNNLVSNPFNVYSDGTVKAELDITTQIKRKHYRWESYCCRYSYGKCRRWCHACKYHHSNYLNDHLILTEEKEVVHYDKIPSAEVTITNQYYNTTKGKFSASNYSLFTLSFDDSFISKQDYYYSLFFDKKPYYFAYIKAELFEKTTVKNIYSNQDTFIIKNPEECHLDAYNHFSSFSSECDMTLHQENIEDLNSDEQSGSLNLLFHISILILLIYLIYKLVKSQFGKFVMPVLILFLLLIPTVYAAPSDEPEEECGLTNLASCIPEKMYEYLLVIINAPLIPLLSGIQGLLTTEVSVDLFHHIWSIIRYILSFFYLFFFLYAGYIFLTSNADPVKRGMAKDLLKDTFLMIILIQASFYIYKLVLLVNASLTGSILPMIDPHFFLLTADNIVNIGLEFLFNMSYGITLFVTLILLVLRYIIVAFGAIIFPIAIFCYFLPPLKGYGKFALNVLGIFIFISFIDLLIILACSMLIEIPVFENFKIIVMITCFGIINWTLFLAIKFALTKSSASNIGEDVSKAMKYIALLA